MLNTYQVTFQSYTTQHRNVGVGKRCLYMTGYGKEINSFARCLFDLTAGGGGEGRDEEEEKEGQRR